MKSWTVDCEIWSQKLETSLYRVVHIRFDIFNRFGMDHQCNRRTDRQTCGQNYNVSILYNSIGLCVKRRALTTTIIHLKNNSKVSVFGFRRRTKLYKFFRYLLRLRRYKRKSVEVAVFRRGLAILSGNFTRKGASPTNHCWYQNSKVIALSFGVKTSAVHHLVLSQCTRVTDGRTDG